VKRCKLLLAVISMSLSVAVLADRVPPGTDDEIRERLQPFGELCRSGEACASGAAATAGCCWWISRNRR
jgi:hypothetical protein